MRRPGAQAPGRFTAERHAVNFEWDDEKRQTNLAKHGIDFELACKIFDGPTIEALDSRRDYGEMRIGAYGEVSGVVLFVIYTVRGKRLRLIIARRAGTEERERFRTLRAAEGNKGDGPN